MWTFCAGCDIIIKIQIYMLKSGTPNTIGTSNKVNEVCYMTVSYKKLWKLLIDRDLKKKDLEEMAGVSHYVTSPLMSYAKCARLLIAPLTTLWK